MLPIGFRTLESLPTQRMERTSRIPKTGLLRRFAKYTFPLVML